MDRDTTRAKIEKQIKVKELRTFNECTIRVSKIKSQVRYKPYFVLPSFSQGVILNFYFQMI